MKSELIGQLTQIAKQAGDAIMEIYKNASDFEIQNKSDNSPLTLADQASNKVICDGLEKLSENYPVISEENKTIDYDLRKDYDQFWLVDPLDGTKEFIKKNGEFTVNIALVRNNAPIIGIVYAPVLGEMYWAEKGKGAYIETMDGIRRIEAKPFELSDSRLNLVCSRSHLNEETSEFISKFDDPQLVSSGSSLKFLIIAKGEAHIYPRIAPTMEWDTGAAQIVLEEAGGKVVRFDDGTPLIYNKENLLNPYFVAYGNVQSN